MWELWHDTWWHQGVPCECRSPISYPVGQRCVHCTGLNPHGWRDEPCSPSKDTAKADVANKWASLAGSMLWLGHIQHLLSGHPYCISCNRCAVAGCVVTVWATMASTQVVRRRCQTSQASKGRVLGAGGVGLTSSGGGSGCWSAICRVLRVSHRCHHVESHRRRINTTHNDVYNQDGVCLHVFPACFGNH